ncbi:MAG: sulfur carrier protein ThiS [Actinomycetota bacterium]
MRVRVNGSDVELEGGSSVRAVVQRYGRDDRGMAVALNGEIVVRSKWNETELTEGDRLEVLGAIGGGQRETG